MVLAILLDKLLKKINTKVFSEKDIKEYIDTLVDYMELNNYYKGTRFVKGDRPLATYSFNTLLIKIHLYQLLKIANTDYLYYKYQCQKPLFINLAILETVYHEVIHIFQNYVFKESDFPLRQLFGNDIMYLNSLDSKDNTYTNYHDFFVIERDANIAAVENILRIIKVYIDSPLLFDLYMERLKSFLIIGYDTTSPIEKIYKDLYYMDPPIIENVDLYDRIRLGFQLSDKELECWNNSQHKIILEKNNLQD